ncbi:1-pyrroline-5-carboxylate dehydrogenase [Catalinimonas alkaloidigena]|uniref:L-glutamate gamma-semialdehyde dehydrogenase n=1 Tax=Catalinimonas alkaloidigena TaxID=1075417 RepID=UPI0024065D35|nr:L-glutamate gamma-semialdehyde dehydrogenase [Catalinimonas alkaloidigena]MDF9800255.1 1-pyrroline-5-carboxylate dehydrogenase [Catalinimonas alkaloidigena]
MSTGFYKVPTPTNEPVYDYAPGTPEREALQATLKAIKEQPVEVPLYIGSEQITTGNKKRLSSPHNHQFTLGHYHEGDASHVQQAIDSALNVKESWENMPWEHRASIFLKAAELISGPYRYQMNAATMLGQSKTAHQSEIDAVCELIDFLRFNVHYMTEVYEQQPPISSKGLWNRLEHRPLEGFILAITPFNFTAISGNLPTAPAMMGNVVLWKPAETQVYAANLLMKIFREAGLPDGVINLINIDGPVVGDVVFKHKDFAGLHFTGSTKVFKQLWKTIGNNIDLYRSYPRIVGETGGKDFIIAHKTADAKALATAITRGAFEFQGQKCSAASRVYIPNNLWEEVKGYILEDHKNLKMGDVEDFSNFMGAVISETAFDKIAGYIDHARKDEMAEIIAGGEYDKSKGYFVQPTIIQAHDPKFKTMEEEIFGPVVTIYVYQAERFEETLELLDQTSPYALTGAVFSQDRMAVELAIRKLRQAAGNFYINDKPTGAVVGQQPFGGARGSGTNDKAGAMINLLRWVSPRTIKENFVPPKDFRYPYMGKDK